jgi:ribosomal protein L17
MSGFIDRAKDWRRRAAELRRVAERMLTSATRASLMDRAASLEHHAENLEQVTTKFRNIHETAATSRPLLDFVPRRPTPAQQHGGDDD